MQGSDTVGEIVGGGGAQGGDIMRAPGDGTGADAGGLSHADIACRVADGDDGFGCAVVAEGSEGDADAVGMRFVVRHLVRADADVDVAVDAEPGAVVTQTGVSFAADDSESFVLRFKGGEQGGDTGEEADVVGGVVAVIAAEVGQQRGIGRIVQRCRAEAAEGGFNGNAHAVHDGGGIRRGQVLRGEGSLGGKDAALGTVGKGAVEVEEDDAIGHGVGRVIGHRAGWRFCRSCG